MSIQTYSPSSIHLIVAGYRVEAWDKIRIIPDAPTFKHIVGIRGKNARVKINNTGCTIKLEVPLTSPLNPIFYKLVSMDAIQGTGRLNITLRDMLGTEVFSTSTGYVEAPAESEFSDKITTREWTIRCMSSQRDASAMSGVDNLLSTISSVFS